jgi:hypothetical protein
MVRKKTEKQAQKDRIKALYPKAIEFYEAVLKDEVVNVNGRKLKVTVAQKLDVVNRVVDQTIGRPAQAVAVGGDTDLPPVRTVTVVKSYRAPEPVSQAPEWMDRAIEEAVTNLEDAK